MPQNEMPVDKRRLPALVVASLMSVIIFCWVLSLKVAYSSFQTTRVEEPFAEIISLFPFFYIVLASYMSVALYMSMKFKLSKFSMYLLLATGAIILWYTPYAIAGFVKQTDTLWYMGLSSNTPRILGGSYMPFSSYVRDFPFTFTFGYAFIEFAGLDVFILGNYFLPLVYILILIFLYFTLFCCFFHQQISLFASLVVLGLHYHVILHHCPQIIGTILLLACMILIVHKKVIPAFFIGLFVLPFVHIISFVFLLSFFLVYLFAKKSKNIYTIIESPRDYITFKNITILFTLFMSFILFLYHNFKYIDYFLSRFEIALIFTFVKEHLIHVPWFKLISSITYFIVFIIFCFVVLYKFYILRGSLKEIFSKLARAEARTATLYIFPPLVLALGILIAVAERSDVLIERGVSFFLVFVSIIACGALINKTRLDVPRVQRAKMTALVLLVILPMSLYPLASYSIDSYNSFPISERAGLEHLTSHMQLDGLTIRMSSPGQINVFVETDTDISFTSHEMADIEVYRRSAEIKRVLHDYEEKHSSTPAMENEDYIKIYHNPSFMIYAYKGG